MARVRRVLLRPAVLLPLLLGVLASVSAAAGLWPKRIAEPRAYVPTERDLAAITLEDERPPFIYPTPTPPPPPPAPPPAPKPKPKPKPRGPDIASFRYLGAWIDLYDYDAIDPEAASADMAAHGVRTLYLQTARWNKPDPAAAGAFQDQAKMERWVRAAHANGMKVVGWYLPAYDNMAREVARTVAIATYRTGDGQRFDALGIDIEYKSQMPTLEAWNAAVADHAKRVRTTVGRLYPIGAIVPAPLGMAVRPQNWTGFPWQALAEVSDVFLPMSYWTNRVDCPQVPEHCAYGYTKGNVEQIRSLTGRPTVPVHVIGGIGDQCTADQIADFARGARDVRAYGGSLYDYRTTNAAFWASLKKLNG